ncbi:MAG: rRNA maturation RNase YbeY [Anaerolineaceae bacterium]|nr:rRNA maturation RNase YbeY [Anaerolineaceae bacterium]
MPYSYYISTRVYPSSNFHTSIPVNHAKLRHAAKETLANRSADPDSAICIVLSLDYYLNELNNKYSGINATTDVLSFPSTENNKYLGDIILSTEYAVRTADQKGHSANEELQLLTVHGTLHLLGYNHSTPNEQKIMWEIQEEILSKLKIAISYPVENT